MPELPEVETIKNVIEPQVQGHIIKNVIINRPEVISYPAAEQFYKAIMGQEISSMSRRGKFLMIHLKNESRIILHLRMTGCLLVTPPDYPAEKHTHIILQLDNGKELRFSDTRRFGRFWLIRSDEEDTYSGIGKLGVEPLSSKCNTEYLQQCLKKRKKKIKECLLDQSVIAGIGNIYSDEILFRAGICPIRPANSLTAAEWQQLAGKFPNACTILLKKIKSLRKITCKQEGKITVTHPFYKCTVMLTNCVQTAAKHLSAQ